jgi:hypothetical protein
LILGPERAGTTPSSTISAHFCDSCRYRFRFVTAQFERLEQKPTETVKGDVVVQAKLAYDATKG